MSLKIGQVNPPEGLCIQVSTYEVKQERIKPYGRQYEVKCWKVKPTWKTMDVTTRQTVNS